MAGPAASGVTVLKERWNMRWVGCGPGVGAGPVVLFSSCIWRCLAQDLNTILRAAHSHCFCFSVIIAFAAYFVRQISPEYHHRSTSGREKVSVCDSICAFPSSAFHYLCISQQRVWLGMPARLSGGGHGGVGSKRNKEKEGGVREGEKQRTCVLE